MVETSIESISCRACFGVEHGRLSPRDGMLRSPDRSSGVERQDLADDEIVHQHSHGG